MLFPVPLRELWCRFMALSMPHVWVDWVSSPESHFPVSVLLISLQSYGGQGEGSALGKVNEKHRCWWRGEPMAALLLFPTISYRAFLKQSGEGRRSRGHRSCLLLVNPYDWKYRVSSSPQIILILPDKLLLFFPLLVYVSASSFVLRL